jgi:hypothetical protein
MGNNIEDVYVSLETTTIVIKDQTFDTSCDCNSAGELYSKKSIIVEQIAPTCQPIYEKRGTLTQLCAAITIRTQYRRNA